MKTAAKSLLVVFFLSLALVFSSTSARAEIDRLTIGIGIDADTLNPQEQTTSLFFNMCELLYDTFFYQTPDFKLEPRLATGLDISDDGLTYTLHLRKGVKFSDGTPLDAKAVKLTIDRALNPKLRVPLRFAINMVKGATVVDDHTVKIHLKYPFAPFGPTLSFCILSPISPAAINPNYA
jgi:ABC-type transport system substrate-binding protein